MNNRSLITIKLSNHIISYIDGIETEHTSSTHLLDYIKHTKPDQIITYGLKMSKHWEHYTILDVGLMHRVLTNTHNQDVPALDWLIQLYLKKPPRSTIIPKLKQVSLVAKKLASDLQASSAWHYYLQAELYYECYIKNSINPDHLPSLEQLEELTNPDAAERETDQLIYDYYYYDNWISDLLDELSSKPHLAFKEELADAKTLITTLEEELEQPLNKHQQAYLKYLYCVINKGGIVLGLYAPYKFNGIRVLNAVEAQLQIKKELHLFFECQKLSALKYACCQVQSIIEEKGAKAYVQDDFIVGIVNKKERDPYYRIFEAVKCATTNNFSVKTRQQLFTNIIIDNK